MAIRSTVPMPMAMIILSGRTYSSQNVRQIWESTLSKSDYLVGHRGRGRTWEWIFKDFFLHFSKWTCQTFCDRCVFVSVLSFGTGSFRPESRSPPESFRPYSRSPRVVSPLFINSALKNEIWKIPLQIFVFWML
jgi:hypothetical protein